MGNLCHESEPSMLRDLTLCGVHNHGQTRTNPLASGSASRQRVGVEQHDGLIVLSLLDVLETGSQNILVWVRNANTGWKLRPIPDLRTISACPGVFTEQCMYHFGQERIVRSSSRDHSSGLFRSIPILLNASPGLHPCKRCGPHPVPADRRQGARSHWKMHPGSLWEGHQDNRGYFCPQYVGT